MVPTLMTTILAERPFAHKTLSSVADGPDRNASILEKQIIKYLYRLIGEPQLQIILWDSTVTGDSTAMSRKIIIRNPRCLRRMIFDVVTGFGDAFMSDEVTVEGDLIDVMAAANRGLARTGSWQHKPLRLFWNRMQHSLSASFANATYHYDLGNDFYKLWLDQQLVYSCAYYSRADFTLEQAQVAKMDHVCRKLRLKAGESVIEAGCGWGALALHMAKNYGVKVRAFNISREQIAYARQRARTMRLEGQVEFIEGDYRMIEGECDAFVSLGMLEHVGTENYRLLGQVIDRVMKSEGGRGFIHSIGRNVAHPLDGWTVKHIFPGAYAPSLREMADIFEGNGFSILDVENLRLHYARTCADWLSRFEHAAKRVRQMFDDRFVRMWRLYLAASSAAFQTGDLQLFQVLFARCDDNHLPMTREDIYQVV